MVKYYDTTSASYESADVTLYEYDALGRRTGKSSATGGASTNGTLYEAYSYAGDRVIADYNGEGDIRYRFVYGEGIDEVVCIMKTTVEGQPRYFGYFTDHLGSVVTLYRYNPLTEIKSIVEQNTYDAYGNVSVDSDGWDYGSQYIFTGRRYDSESGLYYYRARMYNPELGIFQSQDPLGYIDSMNLYAYCANNPVNWVDPWGENFVDDIFETTLDIAGKTWNAPNTALGLAIGGVGMLLGGDAPELGNNAICFDCSPLMLDRAGLTIGNVVLLGDDLNESEKCRVLKHEEQHTRQGEILGPAYLPLHIIDKAFWGMREGPLECGPYGYPYEHPRSEYPGDPLEPQPWPW